MAIDTFTGGAHVKIIAKTHPWKGETGKLLQFQKYGPGGIFSGWKVVLSNGIECFAKRERLKQI